MKFTLIIILFAAVACSSCKIDEYSPNQKFNKETPRNVNATEIARLPKKKVGSDFRFIVSGDTQRKYYESQQFVDYVNTRDDIDFVILNGDISDFGLLLEFNGIYKIYSGLKIPFISIIGNHDQVANGFDIYNIMFGPTNFIFDYAGIKFVCHDSNSREHNFNGKIPDLNWLKDHLKPEKGTEKVIALSHIPPTDADFDQTLSEEYQSLFNRTTGMLASIHSHQHSPDLVYRQNGTGIPFIITNAIVNRAFTIIDIKDGKLSAQAANF